MDKNVFYKVVSGEALAFCIDYRQRRTAHRETFYDYAKSVGAIGWTGGWGELSGLIFENDEGAPKGLIADRRRTTDGRVRWRPHGKLPEGKAFKEAFAALGTEPRGHEFSTRFSIPTGLHYRKSETHYGSMALNAIFPDSAFIAWTGPGNDEFWVVLPDIDGAIADKQAEGYVCDPASWVIPDGIERSTRARYDLALAQAAVREEEEAANASA